MKLVYRVTLATTDPETDGPDLQARISAFAGESPEVSAFDPEEQVPPRYLITSLGIDPPIVGGEIPTTLSEMVTVSVADLWTALGTLASRCEIAAHECHNDGDPEGLCGAWAPVTGGP